MNRVKEANINSQLDEALTEEQLTEEQDLMQIEQGDIQEVLKRITQLRNMMGFRDYGFTASRILIEAAAKIQRLDLSLTFADLAGLRTKDLPEIKAALISRKIDPIKYVENLLNTLCEDPSSLDFNVKKEALLLISDLMNDGVFQLTPVQFTTISMWVTYMTLESTKPEKIIKLAEQMLKLFSEIRIQPVTELSEDVTYSELTPDIIEPDQASG